MTFDTITTYSEQETIDVGEQFAQNLQRGDTIAFYGELGAGKTEFVKGICQYFKVQDLISSPTFTIMNLYNGQLSDGSDVTLYHIDLYRVKNPTELLEIGFIDCIDSPNDIKMVEWSEKAKHFLPTSYYSVTIDIDEQNDMQRSIDIQRLPIETK